MGRSSVPHCHCRAKPSRRPGIKCGPAWTATDKILMQRALAKMPGITSGSFRFYSSLLWDFHSSDTGLCCPSIEQASDNSGLSEKGARNAARALKNVGAIDYDKNTGGRSRPNYYIIKSLHGLPSLQDTWATRVPLKPGERNLAPIADFQGRKL